MECEGATPGPHGRGLAFVDMHDQAAQFGQSPERCVRLDSAPGIASEWSRWSYLAGPARLLLVADLRGKTVLRNGVEVLRRWDNPLAALSWMQQCHAVAHAIKEPGDESPRFGGGWIGYISYELGRWFERIAVHAVDDLKLPLFRFTFHDQLIARDEWTGEMRLLRCEAPPWARQLDEALNDPRTTVGPALQSNFSQQEYERVVARAIDYIAAGDVFQVNLSHRFETAMCEPPLTVYERMRQQSPAWFGAYLPCEDHALLCNSPELFLRVEPVAGGRRLVTTRPIKGTRPLGEGMERALRESEKDQAELNMIVDLERNDLGRVCRIGSVKVTRAREIEAHPTVYHGVATVQGELRDEVGLVDLLRATFPGGSITGAPKIRAMQIIEELEPTRRGAYCGAIGYLGVDGRMEFNIAIRTMVIKGGKAYVQVGGGIVADSVPAEEYQETRVKARAMMRALGICDF